MGIAVTFFLIYLLFAVASTLIFWGFSTRGDYERVGDHYIGKHAMSLNFWSIFSLIAWVITFFALIGLIWNFV